MGADIIDSLLLIVLGAALYGAGVPGAARAIIGGAAAIAYNGLLDGGPTGQTVGKRLLQIRVVGDDTGELIGPSRGLQRAAATLLIGFAAVVPLGIVVPIVNGLWPLWDRKHQTWHDKAVRSVVVVA